MNMAHCSISVSEELDPATQFEEYTIMGELSSMVSSSTGIVFFLGGR